MSKLQKIRKHEFQKNIAPLPEVNLKLLKHRLFLFPEDAEVRINDGKTIREMIDILERRNQAV